MAERTQGIGPSSPGFQGSETSRAEVIVYTSADEPILMQSQSGVLRFEGRSHIDASPSLINVQTHKELCGSAGTFAFEIKSRSDIDFRALISDDDWVDIVYSRHGKNFHVMRGLVDDVRQNQTIVNGATSTTYRIAGRDFQKIFEVTPIWFDRISDGDVEGAAATRIWARNNGFFAGDVKTTVENFLFGFLEELEGKGRANWALPVSIPPPGVSINRLIESQGGVTLTGPGERFRNNVFYFDEQFTNQPSRSSSINPVQFEPRGAYVWPLAVEWSDPELVELYTDLLFTKSGASVRYSLEDEAVETHQTFMSVILRDRPFLTLETSPSPWFALPLFIVPRQSIIQSEVGRGGVERRNAFFVAPKLLQELSAGYLDLQVPLVSRDDILRHGFRRYDIRTNYTALATQSPILTTSREYRDRVRDFHCLNHLFLNGIIALGHGRPDIRIGGRFRIPGESEDRDETYYVETVDHSWTLEQGVRSVFGVTRGWIGSDVSLINALGEVSGRYAPLRSVVPGAGE